MALIVKQSNIPGAGKGLFTTSPIPKGKKVIKYRGEKINMKEYLRRVERNEDGYMFHFDDNYCLDAYKTPQFKARYANDAEGLVRIKGVRNNCEYEIFDDECFIVSKRDIAAGEEIYVDYTKEYWNCIRHNIRLEKERNKKKAKNSSAKKQKA